MSQFKAQESARVKSIITQGLIANQAIAETEVKQQKAIVDVFLIADRTRVFQYNYATLSNQGTIQFHIAGIFKMIDPRPNVDPKHKDKTVWVSVNKDANKDKDPNVNIYYNSNFGNFLTLMKPTMNFNGVEQANFNNRINLQSSRIKDILVPTDMDAVVQTADLQKKLSAPFVWLYQQVHDIKERKLEAREATSLFIEVYKQYAEQIAALYNDGELSLTQALINPTPNKVAVGFQMESTINLKSNGYMNFKALTSQPNVPLSEIPANNSFTGLIEVTGAPIGALFSDNENMLGQRTITTDTKTGKEIQSLSKVGTIKDYNGDTNVLVTITDVFGKTDNSRNRVESFEDLIAKGITSFDVTEGFLVPVVRQLNSNGSRSAVIFFELHIQQYNVHNSNSVKRVMETDEFANLGMESVELDTETLNSVQTAELIMQKEDKALELAQTGSGTDSEVF